MKRCTKKLKRQRRKGIREKKRKTEEMLEKGDSCKND